MKPQKELTPDSGTAADTEAFVASEAPATEPQEESKPLSLAEWMLDGDDLPPTERFDLNGAPAPFFIRRLNVAGLACAGFYAGARVNFTRQEDVNRLAAACFLVGLATDETGEQLLFDSWESAQKAVNVTDPEKVDAASLLFAKILDVNPGIFQKGA